MYFRRKTSAGRAYLQIVESRRDGDQVRQQVIATLGRFEELQASGRLERTQSVQVMRQPGIDGSHIRNVVPYMFCVLSSAPVRSARRGMIQTS